MEKLCKVARISGIKVKWEDWLELNKDLLKLVVESSCERKRDGYLLNENILLEFLEQKIGRALRFALHALLIDVRKGYAIVIYI